MSYSLKQRQFFPELQRAPDYHYLAVMGPRLLAGWQFETWRLSEYIVKQHTCSFGNENKIKVLSADYTCSWITLEEH